MGKKMMKGYKIFILFLLMSVSVFAKKHEETSKSGEQYIYSQITKEDLVNSDKYKVDFYKNIDMITTIDEDGSLDDLLKTEGGFGKKITQKDKEKYSYNDIPKSMVEFKLDKTQGELYEGKFKLKKQKNKNNKIDQKYKIPVPTINFQKIDSEMNIFTYTERNTIWFPQEKVIFRLYTGDKKNGIRPIQKIESNNLNNIYNSNDYVDFVFENNGSQQEITEGGLTAKFIEEKFEIIGLSEGKSYKLDFYTLRYGENGNKEYVVATYEDSLEFVGKNPNEPVDTPSSQWIYSQTTKDALMDSDKYTVDFYENVDTIKTIDEDGNLEKLLKTEDGYGDSFKPLEKERYEYNGESKSMVEFKITSNIGKPQNGKFELTIEEGNVFKRKINENYTIPVPITDFKVQDLESSKNTFTYEDKYELENLKAYKYQEAVFRLYTGSKHDGVRPIKKIEENILNDENYIDFVFENNGSRQEIEKNGIKTKFIEGKFELMGLEDGKSYKLDFYTLRYRDNDNKGNYVAVTCEGSLGFIGKNISTTDDTIWLEDIDLSEYKKIKLNMITVTSEDLKELDILNLVEKRGTEEKKENYEYIKANKTELESIWIDKKEYKVIDNKIMLENDERYVYKWTGSYDTEFEQEEGMVREIKFWSRRYSTLDETPKDEYLIGKYIEATPVEVDTGASHQWVMFEFDPSKEFKNQDYKIEDRVLSPEREGYRQLKTINYESNLDDILYGKNGHTLKKEFTYNNGIWNYPEKNNSAGLIIEKTITESKGNLKGEDDSELVFYTDKTGSGIEKLGEIGNKVTYRWNEGPLNTNGEILSYDKVIFRITKERADNHGWNPYENSNPINYLDDKSDGDVRLEAFLYGNKNYVDIVLDASTSKTMTFTNAIISYEQTNKELRIVGLPVDNYIIQFYSVKRGHDGTYEVITRENKSEFSMDISDIASDEFEKENNIHKIDFITTGTSGGAIQVNINFITKMEREVDLKVKNLKSGAFNIEETNEGTGEKEGIGEAGNMTLKESEMKRVLFPLDVVFVIDNSASMQEEIDAVKNGLTAFSKELYKRGFDVKYNLITFGPEQNHNYYYNYNIYNKEEELYPTGDWHGKVSLYDREYMAIYKDGEGSKWFNGSALNKTSSRENDLEELIDAFENINAVWGYDKGQENSAWGIHHAIKKLRANGRYLSYSGEIVENSSEGYMPSEKMIIFLTDENMDSENIGSLGYTSGNILKKISEELADEEFNGVRDVIDLNGIFHVKKDGNTAEGANEYLTTYDGKENYEVPGLGYKYTSGYNERKEEIHYSKKDWIGQEWVRINYWNKTYKGNPGYQAEEYDRQWVYYSKLEWRNQGVVTREKWEQDYEWSSDYRLDEVVNSGGEWIEYDDNETSILGINPSDTGDISHTDFKYYNTANNFFMYEMGDKGQHVSKALTLAINNLGIIQRWDLSYLTPFNEYDGTTRTVDFELTDLVGRDGIAITRDIKNLNKEEDKQYTVKEEKLALEFKDPSVDNLKLTVVDGRGIITFRGKARYNEFVKENNNKPIVVEDMINEYKLDVLDSNNKLLFSRNTDNIDMSLSDTESSVDIFGDQGWYEFKVDLTEEEMEILIKSTEKINLEATIVTDLFNKTEGLKNVDISTPKITKVNLTNETLKSFLDTMYTINDVQLEFEEKKSKYTNKSPDDIPNDFSGKNGDKIYLELIVEGKDIDKNDVANGITIDGWLNPVVEPYAENGSHEMKKFKVIWKNEGILGNSETRDLIIENNIKRKSGLQASQNVNVLSIDNSNIKVVPTVRGIDIEPIDNIYYVKSIYNIDLGTSDDNLRAGIVVLKYDETQADEKNNGGYYGKPDKYFEIKKPVFGGGEEGNFILVEVDENNKNSNVTHKTDGEYTAQIYGMSRSGKLKGITDYSLNNFKTIMSDNINNSGGEEITIRVDTIAPKFENVKTTESTTLQSNESHYYFDISFDVEDFNARYKKLSSDSVGGYDLIVNDGTIIKTKPEDGNGNPIKYAIEVAKSTVKGAIIAEVTIVAVDKAGNRKEKKVKIRIPKDIKVNTYEELHQTDKDIEKLDGYKFTKGGQGSNIPNPAIYVVVPASDSDDDDKVGKLKIQKLDENGAEEGNSKEVVLSGGDAEKEVKITFNFIEGANIVRVTPISVAGVKGKSKELKFIVDTKINTSYLDTEGIISNLDKKEINIKLSEFEELSGLNKYSYVLSSGKKKQRDEKSIEGGKYLTPTKESGLDNITIPLAGFSDGSRLNFEFKVYDRLGHEKTFEKTYFIPKESDGIIAKVSGEVKQRRSRITILSEGSSNKFGIDSSVDGSSEEEKETAVSGS